MNAKEYEAAKKERNEGRDNGQMQQGVIDPDKYARLIHYPDHWDTAVYPTLDSAITELLSCVGCSECAYETAGQ